MNFITILFKKWLDDNDLKMYSTHNDERSVIAERFIRTLKNNIYKHIAAVSNNIYFDVLDDIVDKYNNKYHRTIKMKPIDVKSGSYVAGFISNAELDKKVETLATKTELMAEQDKII